MANEKYIRERFDIEGLYKIGFIRTKTDFDAIEQRIVQYFGLQNIFEWDTMIDENKRLNAKKLFSNN
jgi:hypothetical protein